MTLHKKTDKRTKPEAYVTTAKEKALLDVLLDPFHRLASVTRQCELAGCSRETYYATMHKPDFMAHYLWLVNSSLKSKVAQLVNIGFKEAKNGSFQHWKVLMEMTGEYAPNKKVEIDQNVSGTVKLSFIDPMTEIDEDDEDDD